MRPTPAYIVNVTSAALGLIVVSLTWACNVAEVRHLSSALYGPPAAGISPLQHHAPTPLRLRRRPRIVITRHSSRSRYANQESSLAALYSPASSAIRLFDIDRAPARLRHGRTASGSSRQPQEFESQGPVTPSIYPGQPTSSLPPAHAIRLPHLMR
ncbi:uncharacterized protein PHACADRAFT_248895 [Phanerochaete carnosa HHB-10118-sp]|uniref:Uncharacterized protein n=1 Tax=Phanerochaete carnosa (strain HHB-10118-sp) TaxID=650164 RepID=K5WHM1_PHACS|nr:uncharacterized protein PHACADRAFT_248895 [Phanerochaete carnosa HHB-10118-sp]EKM58815.1 hypothetical protein PHACADRAFT_248895 [Phanerochaete carnosa HHB-10118-sp]